MDVSRGSVLVSGRRKREQAEHAPCGDFEPSCLRRRELPVGAEALATQQLIQGHELHCFSLPWEKVPTVSSLILPLFLNRFSRLPERKKLYIERKQPTAALMWKMVHLVYCLSSSDRTSCTTAYILDLFWTSNCQLGCSLEEGMCSGVPSSGCLFCLRFFKCRLTYMVLLSGCLKGCCSPSLVRLLF